MNIIFLLKIQWKKKTIDYKAYKSSFDVYWKNHIKPDFYILLDCDWEVAKLRILKRGRQEEIVNFKKNEDYFFKLHNIYFGKLIQSCCNENIKAIVINSNEDKFYEKTENIEKINKIKQEIRKV